MAEMRDAWRRMRCVRVVQIGSLRVGGMMKVDVGEGEAVRKVKRVRWGGVEIIREREFDVNEGAGTETRPSSPV